MIFFVFKDYDSAKDFISIMQQNNLKSNHTNIVNSDHSWNWGAMDIQEDDIVIFYKDCDSVKNKSLKIVNDAIKDLYEWQV